MQAGSGRRLELRRLLGTGGFGEVFLGDLYGSDGFARKVAVKCVRAALQHRADIVGRHRDEARLLGRLGHDHIVQCIDLAEVDGAPAMLLEYVEGVNAGVLLDGAGPLSPRAVAEVVEAVADALAFAHDEAKREDGQPLRVVHRDIKPSNILISVRGAIKVSDFGVARADVAREGQTGALQFGTGAFMAPETWLRLEVSHASDVFALGVTLLHLAGVRTADRWPLDPAHFARVIAQAVGGTGPLFAEVPDLLALLHEMLSWEPADRPAGSVVRQRLADLQGALPGASLARIARGTVPGLLVSQAGDAAVTPSRLTPLASSGGRSVETFAVELQPVEPPPLEPRSVLPAVSTDQVASAPSPAGPRTSPELPAPGLRRKPRWVARV